MGDVADEWGIDALISADACQYCGEHVHEEEETCPTCGKKTGNKSMFTLMNEAMDDH